MSSQKMELFIYLFPFPFSGFMRTLVTCSTRHGQDHLLRKLPLVSPHLPPFSHNVFLPACNHHLQKGHLSQVVSVSGSVRNLANTRGDLCYKSLAKLAALMGTIYGHCTVYSSSLSCLFLVFPLLLITLTQPSTIH